MARNPWISDRMAVAGVVGDVNMREDACLSRNLLTMAYRGIGSEDLLQPSGGL